MKTVERELFEEHDYTNALMYFQQLGECKGKGKCECVFAYHRLILLLFKYIIIFFLESPSSLLITHLLFSSRY